MRLGSYVREDHQPKAVVSSVPAESIPVSIDAVEIYGEF
jgi:hypothetical protein